MRERSRSAGMLLMWAGLVLLFVGLFLVFSDSVPLGIASLAAGAAMEGLGYIFRTRATT